MAGVLKILWDSAEQIVHKHSIFWYKITFLVFDCAIKLVNDRTNCTGFWGTVIVGESHQTDGFLVHLLLMSSVVVHPLCEKYCARAIGSQLAGS